MDRRRTLEESMRKMTLEDGRLDPDPPASSTPESMMDLDGGAAESSRQRGNIVVPLQQQRQQHYPWRTLAPTVVPAAGRGHEEEEEARRVVPPPPPSARAPVWAVEDILLEMLPAGYVLVGYTVDGYLFA